MKSISELEIKALAESMGVSVADLMCLARGVADSIYKDKMDECFVSAPEEFKKEIIYAYLPVAVKKFEIFQTTLLTNPDAKHYFNKRIFMELKAQNAKSNQISRITS